MSRPPIENFLATVMVESVGENRCAKILALPGLKGLQTMGSRV